MDTDTVWWSLRRSSLSYIYCSLGRDTVHQKWTLLFQKRHTSLKRLERFHEYRSYPSFDNADGETTLVTFSIPWQLTIWQLPDSSNWALAAQFERWGEFSTYSGFRCPKILYPISQMTSFDFYFLQRQLPEARHTHLHTSFRSQPEGRTGIVVRYT